MPSDSSGSDLPLERFSRTVDFLGEEGFSRLRRAFVVIVGLGGVGSHAALALARAGIGRLRLVDCDDVVWSNLNRHAVATVSDVGQKKAKVVEKHLCHIQPEIDIDPVHAFFNADTAPELLGGSPDFVIDAIDGLSTKVHLLRYCVENGLKVVSSMGASSRSNPAKVRVADISRTAMCPLARLVRRRLRRQGIDRGVTAIYSEEQARKPLPPDQGDPPVGGGRVRNRQPSLSTMPGIFGYAAANEVILRLAGFGGT
jgi:tRNA A37 threonylcarbamoyladenosine dehydratase